MPARVIEEPLGLECVFSDGTCKTFTVDVAAATDLARDLLVGLVELIHPHGTIDAARTVEAYLLALRRMVTALAEAGFVGGAGALSRARLAEYWMSASVEGEACTRQMLTAFDAATGGLGVGARELAAGRAYNPQPFRRALPPYTEAAWARLIGTCQRVIDASYTAHKQALAAAAAGADPASGGWGRDNVCWLLARRGPLRLTEASAHAGISAWAARRRGGFHRASTDLFPHLRVAIAYQLAFGAYSGVVPDGIADLSTDDVDWAGDASVLLSYVKRRTATESLTLPRAAVRLLEQWLSHSALLRGFAGPAVRDRLWLRLPRPGSVAITGAPIHRNAVRAWAIREGLMADDGQVLKIHRHRIRTTYEAMRDKRGWVGSKRATIDPNHSAQVEGDHYLSATTETQQLAVETVIEDAQHDLLRRAQPPMVLAEADTLALVGQFPQRVRELEVDQQVITELVGGERDVFVAACADQLSGLHGPKGKPCPARPWVCLLCPLAVFAPRHAANLLRLKAFFTRQWQAMPAAGFMTVFGPYAERIDEVLRRYDPAVLTAAAAEVADRDDELPLRPEEHTT